MKLNKYIANNDLGFYLVIIIILLSIHFWGYVGFSQSFFKYTNLFVIGLFLYFIAFGEINSQMRFKGPIFLFIIGIIANIFSAYFNNEQEIRDTFLSFINYYFILLYFFLHKNRISKQNFEVLIIVMAFAYSLFYLWQEAVFPQRVFAGGMFADRGTIRLRIEGNGFLMLGYFLLLNKFMLKRNILHLILALFFFFILFKGGFRTHTAAAVLLSMFIFLRLVRYSLENYLMIILAGVLFFGLMQFGSTSTIFNNMLQTTESQKEEGEEYIRAQQLKFFSNTYPQNFSYYIFGGGLPGARGVYRARMDYIVQENGFYWVDLGLIGFYFVVGLVALLGILSYLMKGIFMKLPKDAIYLKYYLAYLFLVSFTTMEVFKAGIFPVTAITLYLIDISIERESSSSRQIESC